MNESNSAPTAPAKRRWLKRLLFALGSLLVLLVIAWFVATSEAFFKGVILPRAGRAMNATLTADSASISPFSHVIIRGLKVQTTGPDPLLTVKELRAQYSLMAMLGGTLKVDEVLIDSPVINVVVETNGTSNLDALKQGVESAPSAAPAPSHKPVQIPQVDLKQFNLKNATVRYTKHHSPGLQDTVEITAVNVTLADVKNGASGKLEFALQARANLNPPDATRRGAAQLKHEGRYMFALGPDLFPTQISGSDHAYIAQASGALAELADAGADMAVEMNPSEIRTAVLTLRKPGQTLGELRIAGPFDAAKCEGKLTATITGIDRSALNLFGKAAGLDFGNARVNSTNIIELAQGGSLVTVNGDLGIAEFVLTRAAQSTPRLDLTAGYALKLDLVKRAATIQKLDLDGRQNGRAILDSSLSRPMNIPWGNATPSSGEATLKLNLNNLNLAEWKSFLASTVAAGTVSASLAVSPTTDDKALTINLAARLQDFAGAATPSSTLSAKADLNTILALKEGGMDASGKLVIAELVQRTGARELRMPPAGVDFGVSFADQVIELKKVEAALAPTTRSTNKLSLNGRIDMVKPEAITGSLKLTSDSLDLTAYYDLFTGGNAVAKPETKPSPSPAPAAEKEPEAVTLPMRNFTAEASLGHVFLREVDLANFQAKVTLDGSHVAVTPLGGTLNGAPLKGSLELNLGVTGFQYELAFDAPNVPLAPLVNSLLPERKGQIAGTASAKAQLAGAGVTAAGLQKNLSGKFDLVATNLNLSLDEVRMPVIKSLISIVIAIPDAIRNPTAAVGNLVGGLLGVKSENKGWVDEVMKSPLNAIEAHGTAGNGTVRLERTGVASIAFLGEAAGTLEIATVLTNSVMRFPVKISLSKSLAGKAGLMPAGTATNAVYVALPDFMTMGGTLGLPKPDVKYLVLAQLALQSGAGITRNIGGATGETVGGVLGTVGNLLGGGPAPKTNAPAATNPPPANPATDLIRGIGGLLGGGRKEPPSNPPAGR